MADLKDLFPVPAHIAAIARAVTYDLYHGPAWAKIPPAGIEAFTVDMFATYLQDLEDLEGELVTVMDGLEPTLAAFVAELPSVVYEDTFAGEYVTELPEPYEDEDGEPDEDGNLPMIEPDYGDFKEVSTVAELFNATLAKELYR